MQTETDYQNFIRGIVYYLHPNRIYQIDVRISDGIPVRGTQEIEGCVRNSLFSLITPPRLKPILRHEQPSLRYDKKSELEDDRRTAVDELVTIIEREIQPARLIRGKDHRQFTVEGDIPEDKRKRYIQPGSARDHLRNILAILESK